MPDPYRARGEARVSASERRSPLEDFATRLRHLGATPDEVEAVIESWDDVDPDGTPDVDGYPAWTAQRRDEVAASGDTELRAMIDAGRAEHAFGTTTEAEEEDRQVSAARQRAYAEANERIGGSVGAILAWVGDDVHRAEAVIEAETSPDGAQRSTLLRPLYSLMEGADGAP